MARPPPGATASGSTTSPEILDLWLANESLALDNVPPEEQVLDHEPAGRVVELGEGVERIEVGDRVAVPFSLGDGRCPQCRNGHGNVRKSLCAMGEFEAVGIETCEP